MMIQTLTKAQARRFILLRQGLIGDYRYGGTDGVIAFTRSAGCVQYDPVDVCGRSPELMPPRRKIELTLPRQRGNVAAC